MVPAPAALERALAIVGSGEVILATGSLFIAGEVLAAWEASKLAKSQRWER